MSVRNINPQLVKSIKTNCGGDIVIEQFLVALIYEEAEHTGNWRWKETYRKKIDEAIEKWEQSDED